MPVNEFDQSIRPEYVSNRLAIPFNELNAMASQHQKEYDNAEESAYKFKDLMASVKAIHDPSLGLSNIGAKDALYAKYAPRIESISNEIAKGNNINEANRKLSQLQREWINDPTRVELENSYGNYVKYVEDKTKKGDKYAIYKDTYRNTPLVDEKGTLKPFRFNGMGDIQDHAEEARAQMKDIAKSGYDSKNSQLAADGNIYTKDSHGKYVLDTRVDQLAEEKVVPFIQTEKGKDYLELIKYQNPNASQEDIFKQVKSYLKAAGANQIFKDIGGGNTVDVTGLSLKKYDEGKAKEEAERAMIGQPIEGATINLTKDDTRFNSLKESGVYKENPDGTLNVDLKALDKKIPIYDVVDVNGRKVSTIVGYKDNKQLQKELGQHLGDIAYSIGYSKPITPANFNDIISKYNDYSKVRMSDEQMPAPVSKIESEKAMRNWNNYDVMNIDSPDKPLEEKPVLEKGDKLVLNNWRNTPNGKMNRDGFIRKEDGTIVPIMVRPKAIIDDKYHNTISEIGLLSAQYEAGKVKPVRTEGTGKGKIEVINDKDIPGVGKLETFGFIDSKTDKKTTGYLMTPEDGTGPIRFSTQADMQQYLNYKYYGTETGNTDRYNVAPNKATFEDTEQEQQ